MRRPSLAPCLLVVAAPLVAQQPSADAAASNRFALAALPITARIPVPSSPDWLAMGFGSVWVVNYKPDRVSRIDPLTARVVADIPLGPNACLAIAVAAGRLWIPTCGDGVVNEIDPRRQRIVRRIPVPIAIGREGAFAISGGSLWIPSNVPDTASTVLVRVDIRSGQLTARIPVGARSDVVVAGFGALWVSSSAADTIYCIDPARNAVVATIGVGPSPKFMVAAEGSLWVQNRGDGTVSRIDPRARREIARIPTAAPTPWGDIAAGEGAIWLSVNGTPVTRIDPRTNHVTHQFVGSDGADAIRTGFGMVWVADHKHGEVWRINATTLKQ